MESDLDLIRLYQPPSHPDCNGGRCEDWLLTFLYCIVVPVSIIFIFILFVVICACKNSCKCKKYSSLIGENNDIQLEDYNTIRRASLSLRQMSHNRETPIMGSRAGSMTLDRSYRRNRRGMEAGNSAPGTLQRQNRNRQSTTTADDEVPLPPTYCIQTDQLFSGSDPQRQSIDGQRPLPPPYNYNTQIQFNDTVFRSDNAPPDDIQTSYNSDNNPERNGHGSQPLLYRY